MALTEIPDRVLSGMRPTGKLHLGHYHGVVKPWVKLQHEHECYFFVADWHALTTEYKSVSTKEMTSNVYDMVIDWLACGVDPSVATIFVQSRVPQHAELHLLLSMITPLGWLERVPSFKDQQEQLKDRDLSTYGFLGYPLLQSADILMYRATLVPVGEDQVPHIELTREIAKRFNHLFGRDENFQNKAKLAIQKLGKTGSVRYEKLRREYLETGNKEALANVRAMVVNSPNLSIGQRERLLGYLEGGGRILLPEPQPYLVEARKVPGLDGQKMSKSYNNAIYLRDDLEKIRTGVRTMPTDPARVRRHDPGNPEKCPVWDLHKLYSSEEVKQWVCDGCKTASIGCKECKDPLIDEIIDEQNEHAERAQPYIEDPEYLKKVIAEGCEHADDVADETMEIVRRFIGIGGYR